MKKQKLQIFSDIHMEAYADPSYIWNFVQPKAKIAVVAGDIHSKRFVDMINEIATKFEKVICVLGNHDWYGKDITWKPDANLIASNVSVLNPGVCNHNGIVFIGATLWSDFKNSDYFVMDAAKSFINDFRKITYHKERNFKPKDAAGIHHKEKSFIRLMLEKYANSDEKVVVLTHFLPSYSLIHDKWKGSNTDTLNYYFSAQCDDVVAYGGADLWVFGHTHDERDMLLGDTRCVCNPLGYPKENVSFNNKVVLI